MSKNEAILLKKAMDRLERKMEKAKGPIEQNRIVKAYLAKRKKYNKIMGIQDEE